MSQLADSITLVAGGRFPRNLTFDLSPLRFIRPAGVCFLSNLTQWFYDQEVSVAFVTGDRLTAPINYLDDSLFFEQHCGRKLRAGARPRATTMPLRRLKFEESHMWLRLQFIPWLAGRVGVQEASVADIQVCLSELFNNIRDHTRLDIGSIFMQHFPAKKSLSIAVADFGVGIPYNVRSVRPGISDADAIIQAVEDGFTTRSLPTNAGSGLDYLLRVIVESHGGTVTVYSQRGMVQFRKGLGAPKAVRYPRAGLSPGTLFEIELPTRDLRSDDDDRGELEW